MVDVDSDDGSWAGYIADMERIGRLRVVSDDKLRITELEKQLEKAQKYIAKLERANRILAELVIK
jgi:TolA-binding protein